MENDFKDFSSPLWLFCLCERAPLVAQMVKKPTSKVGDLGPVPESGRSPGEGNGNPLQYPCLENYMDRGTWWATVHGITKSDTTLCVLNCN